MPVLLVDAYGISDDCSVAALVLVEELARKPQKPYFPVDKAKKVIESGVAVRKVDRHDGNVRPLDQVYH